VAQGGAYDGRALYPQGALWMGNEPKDCPRSSGKFQSRLHIVNDCTLLHAGYG